MTIEPNDNAMISNLPRTLSRSETHDLSMIIKDRTKVLKAHAEEQAANCMADFEAKLAAIYHWDQDEVWRSAAEAALKAAKEAEGIIAKRCEELGIPKQFAPHLSVEWQGRGENALAQRRTELRRVARTSIEAMMKTAITRIERQSLDLRTQVVSMGVLSENGKMFLESLAPVEDAMRSLDFGEMEAKLEKEKEARLQTRRNLGLGYS